MSEEDRRKDTESAAIEGSKPENSIENTEAGGVAPAQLGRGARDPLAAPESNLS